MHITALDDAAWDSPWRTIPVGHKVALSGALLLTALVSPVWPGCVAVATAAVALTLGWARIPLRTLTLAMTPPLAFIVIGGLTVAVVLGGEPSASALVAGPLWLDSDSIERGISATAHGIAGTLSLMLLATTTPMSDLLSWLRSLGVPAPLVEVAGLTYRLLFVLLEVALAIRAAQLARLGNVARGTRRVNHGLHQAASAAGSVLLRAWDRSSRLQAGLEGRGYTGELRTLAPVHAVSVAFVAVGLAVVAGIWALTLVAGLR
ncbi:MAG: cobalt ECF transporter T component CbiQ [Dermatophilus congolensis]|nr:cobalt ECF transporter T component CbiQ [Dermatophilus congolensis]